MSEPTVDATFFPEVVAREGEGEMEVDVEVGGAAVGESSVGSSQTVCPLFILYQYLRPSGRTCSSQF